MKKIFGLIVTLCISLYLVYPLTRPGYFPMHDDTQVARVYVMAKALKSGQFPVRWVSDLGYGLGYPIFNFYGPLPYYWGGWLHTLGIDILYATKIMIASGLILSGITMYVLAYEMFGFTYAVAASTLFLSAPYHAVQIYVRGSVGELWSMAFFSLFILGVFRIISHKDRVDGVLWGSVGLTGVVLSHTLLGYLGILLALVLIIAATVIRRKYDIVRPLVLVYIQSLFLCAFFILPMIFEMKYTNVSSQISPTSYYADHFVCIRQLWDSPWGFGGSAPGCIDGMSFMIGKWHVIFSMISIVSLVLYKKKFLHAPQGAIVKYAAFLFAISIFMMMKQSGFLWQIIPGMSFVQYPWRFLSYVMFAASIVGPIVIVRLPYRSYKVVVSACIVVTSLLVYTKIFLPQYTYTRLSNDFIEDRELHFKVSAISDEYLPPDVLKPQRQTDIMIQPLFVSEYPVKIEYEITRDTRIMARFDSERQQNITIRRVFFPGWLYTVNGQRVVPKIKDALPIVTIPEGRSTVEADFVNTPVRSIGNSISIIGVLLFLFVYGKKIKT